MIIQLSRGFQTVIDDEDYEKPFTFWHVSGEKFQFRICDSRWYYHLGYARTNRRKPNRQYQFFIHRLLLEQKPGIITDHIDRDKLNNRRSNLRTLTNRENTLNSGLVKGFSRFRGVSWNKRRQYWESYIINNLKKYHLGCFTDEIEAAKCYNKVAEKYHGEFAHFNIFDEE
ncbi:MAG: hypothetical protein HN975_02135 [Anaerolineae bacterium]|jgi:hypothetical protein|nr:hypothetical protein [Anaerolineae bacterium]